MYEQKFQYVSSIKSHICLIIRTQYSASIIRIQYSIYAFNRECRVTNPKSIAEDDKLSQQLWDYTCRLLDLSLDEDLPTFLETVTHQLDNISLNDLS